MIFHDTLRLPPLDLSPASAMALASSNHELLLFGWDQKCLKGQHNRESISNKDKPETSKHHQSPLTRSDNHSIVADEVAGLASAKDEHGRSSGKSSNGSRSHKMVHVDDDAYYEQVKAARIKVKADQARASLRDE